MSTLFLILCIAFAIGLLFFVNEFPAIQTGGTSWPTVEYIYHRFRLYRVNW